MPAINENIEIKEFSDRRVITRRVWEWDIKLVRYYISTTYNIEVISIRRARECLALFNKTTELR